MGVELGFCVFDRVGESVAGDARYHRQTLLAQIGDDGQKRLSCAHVLIVGCGALGAPAAEWLVRAGVGMVTLADRDVVELTNLQRQTLYSERDAMDAVPKAVAAAARLAEINLRVRVRPVVVDVGAHNIDLLLSAVEAGEHDADGVPPAGVILDGTDNVATRYLLNDAAVERGVPLIYGGAIGTEGRQATFVPMAGAYRTSCLRCAFGEPPPPGSLPTCDTVGVLGPVAGIVAACQAVDAIKVLTGNLGALSGSVLSFDGWANERRRVGIRGQQDPDCPCCGLRRFDFLRPGFGEERGGLTSSLCGRNAVQISPPIGGGVGGVGGGAVIDLAGLASRWRQAGPTVVTPYMVRLTLGSPLATTLASDGEHSDRDGVEYGPGRSGSSGETVSAGTGHRVELTVFGDGRAIVSGTNDPARARSLYDRYVGA